MPTDWALTPAQARGNSFGDAEHLAPFGYVSLPPLPVETLIALSILLVAVEAIHRKDGIYIESALDPQYSL